MYRSTATTTNSFDHLLSSSSRKKHKICFQETIVLKNVQSKLLSCEQMWKGKMKHRPRPSRTVCIDRVCFVFLLVSPPPPPLLFFSCSIQCKQLTTIVRYLNEQMCENEGENTQEKNSDRNTLNWKRKGKRRRRRNIEQVYFLVFFSLSFSVLIIQFCSLSFCSNFFSFFLCGICLYVSQGKKWKKNGTRLSFSLIILVIYDGGRHPIEIARRDVYTHGRSSFIFSWCYCVLYMAVKIKQTDPMHDHHYCQSF